jgi:hypothetical protein
MVFAPGLFVGFYVNRTMLQLDIRDKIISSSRGEYYKIAKGLSVNMQVDMQRRHAASTFDRQRRQATG